MRVLLLGGTGFLGRSLSLALARAGHEVVCASRHAPAEPGPLRHVVADLGRMTQPADWRPLLAGVDAVVNTVGLFREHPAQTFDAVHVQGPRALFEACVEAGVRRVVQVSALGADAAAETPYHLSKRAADDHLLSLPLAATVVQPSLVFGPGGASATSFGTWATLPLVPLPGDGSQPLQPIHLDDVVEALVALLGPRHDAVGRRIALVGPSRLSLRQFLLGLRRLLGLGPALTLPVPMPFMRAVAALAGQLRGSLLDPASLSMLARGNAAPAADTAALLGRPPRPLDAFIAAEDVPAARARAVLGWGRPLLRISIALVWLVTGVLSLGVFPVDQSLALLARVGAHGPWALWLLYGAAGFDLALGVATLLWRRRWVWQLQAALIVLYTGLISVFLPDFWLHPFGPVLKNLPLLAAIAVMWAMEER